MKYINYDRPKLAADISTPMGHTFKVGERPGLGIEPSVYPMIKFPSANPNTFRISGDRTIDFPADGQFEVKGSVSNDGTYTVVSTSYDSALQHLEITVTESVVTTDRTGSIYVGNTAILDVTVEVDADESVGVDIQDLWRLVVEPKVDVTTGEITLDLTVNSVRGGGTVGPTHTKTVVHEETMDKWQADAGRARQP